EVLEHDAARHERHVRAGVRAAPARDGLDVLLADVLPAGVPEGVLEKHPDRERQAVDRIEDAGLHETGDPVEGGGTLREIEGRSGSEWISLHVRHGWGSCSSSRCALEP